MRIHTVWAVLGLVYAPLLRAQTGETPVFEVASIKACKPGEIWPGVEPVTSGTGKVAAGDSGSQSPGTLHLKCTPVRSLMKMAYLEYDGGHRDLSEALVGRIEGGPAWVDSSRYAIDAKSPQPASPMMMRGPMLQALLAERFQLKLRRETREVEVYELTIAKGGVKMRRTVEGSCVPRDPEQVGLPPKAPDGKPWCSTMHYISSMKTMTGILDGIGVTPAEFAPYLNHQGRRVIDKTRLEGRFDFHLEYLRDGGPPPEDRDPAHAAPDLFDAVEKVLGLKITPARGRVEFLVVDRIERPSDN